MLEFSLGFRCLRFRAGGLGFREFGLVHFSTWRVQGLGWWKTWFRICKVWAIGFRAYNGVGSNRKGKCGIQHKYHIHGQMCNACLSLEQEHADVYMLVCLDNGTNSFSVYIGECVYTHMCTIACAGVYS